MMKPSEIVMSVTALLGGTGMLLVFFTSWKKTGSVMLVLGMLCAALHETLVKVLTASREDAS
jgi:hypothetical protein